MSKASVDNECGLSMCAMIGLELWNLVQTCAKEQASAEDHSATVTHIDRSCPYTRIMKEDSGHCILVHLYQQKRLVAVGQNCSCVSYLDWTAAIHHHLKPTKLVSQQGT